MGKRSPHEATCRRIASGLKTIQGRSVSAANPISFHAFSRSVVTTMRPWRVGAAMNAATKLGAGQTRRKNMERRDFIKSAGLVAGIVAASTLGQRSANAETAQQPGAKRMAYEIKPFSLDPKSVKGISEKILISHYENNYVGAVKRLNAIAAQLAELDYSKAPGFVINGLKREELIAMNSMILHEAYFDSLGRGRAARGALADAIARDFGSAER